MRAALEREGFEVVGEAGTSEEAVAGAAATRPDACLIDIAIRGGGLDAARDIKRRLPQTEVIILTEVQSQAELRDALRAGAAGYLAKHVEPARFAAAVRGVLAGEATIPRAMVGTLVEDHHERESRRRHEVERRLDIRLTTREWQVMGLLHQRLSTEEVAGRLEISAVTVRRHASDVARKLGVPDRRTALARFADAHR
jgi:DNA-binding NarL/FixJ family response regulator